jgi:hypothetical protein
MQIDTRITFEYTLNRTIDIFILSFNLPPGIDSVVTIGTSSVGGNVSVV